VKGLKGIVARLANGSTGRTEADIQADVRSFLLEASFELAESDLEVFLESPAGGGRRIDVETGCAVIEVKKNLRSPKSVEAACAQLAAYVEHRTEEHSQRYVGVLTDGRTWILYHLEPGGTLAEASRLVLRDGSVDRLSAWLEAVLATRQGVSPTPREIIGRLGAGSPAAQLDLADLHALYAACRANPEVQVKRDLWARLLSSALGTGFEDSDDLFVTHTYLVLSAELIAHEIMGLEADLAKGDLRELLEGQQFAMAGLHGVVEADFFDWPATIAEGQPIIAAIARRLSSFDWKDVRHDVLKVLYESLIDTATRHRLGEYYTPDWLAEKMVGKHFDDPMNQRVLDPSCGSGTFLFWAIRRLLRACDEEGISNHDALKRVVSQIQGMDLHPVAVTLARVTYLLALTPKRLEDRGELTVPVFLGDSVRWEQEDTVLTEEGMTVRTTDPFELVSDDLHFPEGVVEEPHRFDRLVADLAKKAASRRPGTKPPGIKGILNRHKVAGEKDREAVEIAFRKLCRLHDDGRDHIWSYYIRNLARPLSFTRTDKRADLLIGNPPWLAFRSMPKKLQDTYRLLAGERGLWAGGKVATHQDLSDLFVARSVEQYLKPKGKFAFVMPFAVLSRGQFSGFRSGNWTVGDEGARVHFGFPEEFASVKPPIFAVPACVICGVKTESAHGLPAESVIWTGRLPADQLDWTVASEHLVSVEGSIATASGSPDSPYKDKFRQGAALVPRMLVTAEPVAGGPLGVTAGNTRIRSARSSNEKLPWKSLPSLEGVVENQFLRPVHLGSTIVAYRARDPWLAVVPYLDGALIDAGSDRLDEFPGLAAWWHEAEHVWATNKSETTRLTLLEQVDFQSKLSNQFPLAAERVVYTASGQHLAACRITDSSAVIEKALYWATVNSPEEGRYLCAVFNSDLLSATVRPLQSRGQHNPRHFDSTVFALPFPVFDAEDALHIRIAELGRQAEELTTTLDLDAHGQFQKARRVVREALEDSEISTQIDRAVAELVSPKRPSRESKAGDLMGALSEAKKAKPDTARKGSRKRTPTKRTKKTAGAKTRTIGIE
jgi:hypothetical protein